MTTVTEQFRNGMLGGVQGTVKFQSVGMHGSADGAFTILGVKFPVLVQASGAFTVNLDPGPYRVWLEFIGFTSGPHPIVVPTVGTPKLRTLIEAGG